MLRKTLFLVLATGLVALLTASDAQAWGAYHAGYTHVGPGGVQHVGYTAARGPYGGGYSVHNMSYGGAGYGAYRSVSYGGAGYGGYHAYHAGYGGGYAVGGYHYGGYGYGGYSAGVYRAW